MMNTSPGILLIFGQQIGLLTSIVVALAFVRRFAGSGFRPVHQLISGAALGGAASLAMLEPITLVPGVIFDARSVIIAISGPFSGPLSTLIATGIAAGYRTSLGGSGVGPALVSLAAAGTVSAAYAGMLRRRGRQMEPRDLPVLAVLTSLVNVAAFLLLPADVIGRVLGTLTLPLIATNFVGIGVLGLVLIEERRRRELQRNLAAALEDQKTQARHLVDQAAQLRRQASRLGTSEAQYRLLAENTSDMIIRADPSARRLYVSAGSRAVVGFAPDELIGTNPRSFVHPDDASGLVGKLEALGRGEVDQASNVHRFRHKDGHWVWVEVKFRLIRTASGEPREVVSVIRDISERMQLEEQLRQAQKMQTLGQLTGGIAHDFNNLLVVVLGNAEILTEELSQARHKDLAAQIQASAEQAADLTRKLLAFGRRQSLSPEMLDLSRIAEGMVSLLRRTLGAEVALQTAIGGPALAFADRTLLESAILNLALNARDAMPEGGHLTLRTGRRVTEAEEGDLPAGQSVVSLTIEDTGGGIAPEILGRVFEPFFTTKGVGKGSGLGLSMVYGFAKQSGGHIAIESRVGRGTSVSIILRAAEASAASVCGTEGDTLVQAPSAQHPGVAVDRDRLARDRAGARAA